MGDRVHLAGRVQRDLVTQYLDEADCFIMISRREAYGLVYLEAMARGCIAIASRNEGFDGIIRDGENGFLCEAGNAEELASIIRRINAMTAAERQAISENGMKTARRMTDYKMAEEYIGRVLRMIMCIIILCCHCHAYTQHWQNDISCFHSVTCL